jgi:hypothetical protein
MIHVLAVNTIQALFPYRFVTEIDDHLTEVLTLYNYKSHH